jgi:hypothetical protein
MQTRALGLCLAFGLAGVLAACDEDSNKRHAPDGDAGAGASDGGTDAGRPGTNAGGEGPAEDGGNAGAANAGQPTMSAAGDKGNGGSAGDGSVAACAAYDELLTSNPLCDSVRTCYADLQEAETACVAPGNDGAIDSYQFLDISRSPNVAAIKTCLCALSDQPSAQGFVNCLVAALQQGGDCYSSCPAFGDGCADPYQEASIACNDQYPEGFADVGGCFQAQ